jgi:hypothetical protein
MRELHGVMALHVIDNPAASLKQRALLFDAIHIVGLEQVMGNLDRVLSLPGAAGQTNWPERRAELDYSSRAGISPFGDGGLFGSARRIWTTCIRSGFVY